MNDVQDIGGAFAMVPLFARLSAGQRERLARKATTRSFRPGTVIVREGDTSMSLYVVLSGRVRIVREAEGGGAIPIAEAARGGFFGEMGLIDDEPRAASVVALEPTMCALLAKWDFQNELRQDPDIALTLLPILNRRIRELEARLAQQPAASSM
jgi:CRP/FNR family cyclic AMP-dependent transcriptional regulator